MSDDLSAESSAESSAKLSDDEPVAIARVKRPVLDDEMDIAPMIDMTFLLLIFFIVAARIDTAPSVELPTARHASAVATKNAVVVTVAAADEKGAVIYLGDGMEPDKRVKSVDFADQENEIIQYLETSLADPRLTQIVVKAEGLVSARHVKRVMEAAGRLSKDVPVINLAVREEK